jgi:predicted lipoprotein
MKTIDLSDLKAGNKAWSAMHGEVTIKMVYSTGMIQTELKLIHYQNGTFFKDDTHPTLFHSEQEFREYWGLGATLEAFESNQLTKREQFAMAAMQGLLANSEYWGANSIDALVNTSVEQADALLTKLNEKP